MLILIVIAYVIYIFCQKKEINQIRKNIFTLIIVLSLFFWSSRESVLGIQL